MCRHSFDIVPFEAFDGFSCNLWHLKRTSPALKGPVLLVHGAGVRSNIFNPPGQKNLIDVLEDEGYDVWMENWRGSIECEKNEWNLDLAAENDHPAAVQEVCRISGATSIKAIIHCQGSTSFMISAVKGLLPQVNTVISNAVSLHPVVPEFSEFKIDYVLPVIKPVTKYLNPEWGDHAPDLKAKAFRLLVNLTHWEDDTEVGKFVSFTYGSGRPALWELNNLTGTVKEWIRKEFGPVPLTFFEHIKKCINTGTLVSADASVDYTKSKPKTDARFAFFAGRLNKCFRSEGQERTWRYFDALQPGYHRLHLFDTYSHLDIFFGKNASHDVFPAMIRELNN